MSAKLDATGQRWIASLANYDIRSGIKNIDADALSKQTKQTSSDDTINGQDMIKAIAFATQIEGLALADTFTKSRNNYTSYNTTKCT